MRNRWVVLVAALGLIAGACSDDGSGDTESTVESTSTTEAEDDTAGDAALSSSEEFVAALDGDYKIENLGPEAADHGPDSEVTIACSLEKCTVTQDEDDGPNPNGAYEWERISDSVLILPRPFPCRNDGGELLVVSKFDFHDDGSFTFTKSDADPVACTVGAEDVVLGEGERVG
jgi:hypothetical protein